MEYRYRWGGHVESLDVDGEWLIMDPEQMTMTKLNQVATHIWANLRTPKTINELIDELTLEFDVSREQAEPDVQKFLNELSQIHLIEQETVAG